jgi:flavin reductase (DIM6/NTAB) family NADH-FMN oxidoreductase RutF
MKPADPIYAMKRHLVEPTVFVLSVDQEGKPNGMSSSWNMKCSYEPAMLSVAIGNDRNTLRLIKTSKEFVIAVPSPELREQLEYFGSITGEKVDKFDVSGVATLPNEEGKTPLLADARINFVCRLEDCFNFGGDHQLVVGRIVGAYLNEDKKQLYFTGRNTENKRTFDAFWQQPPAV